MNPGDISDDEIRFRIRKAEMARIDQNIMKDYVLKLIGMNGNIGENASSILMLIESDPVLKGKLISKELLEQGVTHVRKRLSSKPVSLGIRLDDAPKEFISGLANSKRG